MNRTSVARGLRAAMVACGVAALLLLLVDCGPLLLGYSGAGSGSAVLLPFVAVGVCAVGLGFVLPRVDAAVGRLTHHREVTPYSALAAAAARIRAGALEQALLGLAQVVADGTGPSGAVVWLAVGDRLAAAAEHPPRACTDSGEEHVPNLAVLLARPATDHVVPVL